MTRDFCLVGKESTIIFALNLNAAQLREVLKLFGEFVETELY